MTPITDRLSALAAQMREDARQAGINATKARPAVEKAAADVEAARKLLAEAEKAHREALAVVARHELEGQKAADVAAELDRLAAEHRTAPELPTPDEAVAAAGLIADRRTEHRELVEELVAADSRDLPPAPDGVLPYADLLGCDVTVITTSAGRVRGRLHATSPDGLVLDVGGSHFQGSEIPLTSIQAVTSDADDEMPFNVVPASSQTVAAVEQATGELVAVHGPGVTAPMSDRLAAERFPGPRHEKPKERPGLRERITRRTGPHRVIASPDATRPDGDVPDALLAEGERQARPDDSRENDR